MPHGLTEEPLQFGEGGRLFGILTHPEPWPRNSPALPTFLFLNAGLVHRVGPGRLYVRLARGLVRHGFASLRIDLSGRGDSPARTGVTNEQAVAADYEEVVRVLEARLGPVKLVVGGLCSGADDAVRLSIQDERVIGMLLIDPICFSDDGFRARARIMKYSNPARYRVGLKIRIGRLLAGATARDGEGEEHLEAMDPLELRDLPSKDQMRAAFLAVRERNGRVLSVFSGYSLSYYNQVGQLRRVLDLADGEDWCSELFWPEAQHTYTVEGHRRRLVAHVEAWAHGFAVEQTVVTQ